MKMLGAKNVETKVGLQNGIEANITNWG